MTEGFDVGMEMSGNGEAFRSMLDAMNHAGGSRFFGIFADPVSIDWSQVIFKGLQLKGVMGARCSRPGTRWPACCRVASIFPHHHAPLPGGVVFRKAST